MRTRLVVAFFLLVGLGLLPAGPALAEESPTFWTGPSNGMNVYGTPHGQLVVPYVVAHIAEADVACTLLIYTMRGPQQIDLLSLPMGTVKAAPADFCNVPTGELPFVYIWDDVTLDVGQYRCKVLAFDGTAWADSDMWCYVDIKSAPDTTPPLGTTARDDGSWHRRSLDLGFTITDDPGGWGSWGGLAHVDYSRDGGVTWRRAGWAEFPIGKRGGGSGVHTILFRGTDAAGNEEQTIHSWQVRMDGRPPLTTNDAPLAPRTGDVTVHFTAVDNMVGVTACSGVAETWYRIDDGRWMQGAQVTVPAAHNAGAHTIAYYSTDVAGNVEGMRYCSVTIALQAATGGVAERRTR